MNLYFVYGDQASSRPSSPARCCAGITRDSLLTLAARPRLRGRGGPRSPSTSGRRDTENGTLTEVFACGTAAVITPVGPVKSARRRVEAVPAGEPGEVTHAAAQGAAGHPDGHGRGHPRLDAPAGLTPARAVRTKARPRAHRWRAFVVLGRAVRRAPRRGQLRRCRPRPWPEPAGVSSR